MFKKTALLLLLLCSFTLASKSQDLTKSWANLLPDSTSVLSQEVDESGNLVILSQHFTVVDYDPDGPTGETSNTQGYGIIKYNINGDYLWSTFYEIDSLSITDLGIDTIGNIYVYANYAGSVNINPSGDAIEINSKDDSRDITLIKLDSDGNYSSHVVLGGEGVEDSEKLFITESGKVILSGSFDGNTQSGVDFNPALNEQDSLRSNNELGDGSDHFILRLNNDLTYDWAYQLDKLNGGIFTVNDIATNEIGDVFVCGDTDEWFRSSTLIRSDTVGYVMKLNTEGTLLWKRRPTTYSYIKEKKVSMYYTESIQSIAVSNTGDVFLSGYCLLDTVIIGLDADTVNVNQYYDNASNDIFLSRLDGKSGWQRWRRMIEASGDDNAHTISVNQNGNIYAFGKISEDTLFDEVNIEKGAFIIEMSNSGTLLKSKKIDVVSIEQVAENPLKKGYYLSGRLNASSSDLDLSVVTETYYLSDFHFNYTSDTTIWNGESWSNGKPTIDMPAIIDGDYSTYYHGNLFASKLIVRENVTIDVFYKESIEVDGEVANEGNINIKSLGVFLHSSYSGNGKFRIDIRGGRSAAYKYISSPVQDQELLPILPSYSRSLRYEVGNSIDNKAENWIHITDSTLTMDEGLGFAVWRMVSMTFEGAPNSGDITVPLNYINEDGNNLVGNPYPSPISGEQFLLDNPEISALYFWQDDRTEGGDYNSSDYLTWNLSGASKGGSLISSELRNIATGQGFIVQVDTTDQNLEFSNHQRQSIIESFFRKKSYNGRLWLKFEGEQQERELLVATMDWATEGFDKGWDALDFSSNSNNLSFSTLSVENQRLAIQALSIQEEYLIPVYLSNFVGKGEINISEIEGFNNYEIKLIDHKKSTSWVLSQSSYKFVAEEGETERFSLSIGPKLGEVLSLEKTLQDNMKIGTVENGVNVISPINVSLTIYNLSGQVIEVLEMKKGEVFIPTKRGEILFFHFNTDKESFTKKVIR